MSELRLQAWKDIGIKEERERILKLISDALDEIYSNLRKINSANKGFDCRIEHDDRDIWDRGFYDGKCRSLEQLREKLKNEA